MANDVTIRMGVDKSAVEAGLRSVRASVSSFAQEKFDGLKSALGFGSIVAGIGDTINRMAQLKRDAEDFGVDTSFLQTFSHLTEKFGGSADDAGAALQKFNVLIGEARSGTEAAAQKFAALGISLTDASGRSKGTQELLKEVADAYARTGDSADKAAIAMDFFGRKGAAINNVLALGREELEKTQALYLRLGLVVSEANVNAIAELKQGFGSIGSILQSLLGVTVRFWSAVFNVHASAGEAIKQLFLDLKDGRPLDFEAARQTVVDGLTEAERRYAQAARDSGAAATQSAAAVTKAENDKRKAQEDLERAMLEMADEETKLTALKEQQRQIVMDLEEHALNEVESLRKQVELQKNKNDVARLEEQIANRKAQQTEREAKAVEAINSARMTLARRQQDLQTTKEDRSKYTLEELAQGAGRFGGERGRYANMAREALMLEKQAEFARFNLFDPEKAKELQNRADLLKKNNVFLREGERNPFKAMESGIEESAKALKELIDKANGKGGGVAVLPVNGK